MGDYVIAPPPPSSRPPSDRRRTSGEAVSNPFHSSSQQSSSSSIGSSSNPFEDTGTLQIVRGSASRPQQGWPSTANSSAFPAAARGQEQDDDFGGEEDDDDDDTKITFVRGSALQIAAPERAGPPPSAKHAPPDLPDGPKPTRGILRDKSTPSKSGHVRWPSEAHKLQEFIPTEDDDDGEGYVLYQALYDYKSDDPDDLQFDANDILRVTDEGDGPESWFYGESQDGREGSFPGTFVRKINLQPKALVISESGQAVKETAAPAAPAKSVDDLKQEVQQYKLYQALFDYNSGDPDDLVFEANDIIRVTDEGEGPQSWWYGETQDGREGSFPGTYVRKIAMRSQTITIGGLEHAS